MNFTVVQLSSGMRLVHIQTPTELIWCGVTVGVGSRDELPEQEGMAHFIEHLVFKGTKTRNNIQLINRIEDVGGDLNAFTTKEYTTYYANCLKIDMARAVDLVLDLAINPSFPDNEIEKERNVILDEILSYKDAPAEAISDQFDELLFNEHPLAHNILGNAKSLKKIQRKDILAFYQKFYTASNMVIGFLGDVPVEKVVAFIEKRIPNVLQLKTEIERALPYRIIPQVKIEKRKFHQTHCIMGGNAPSSVDKNWYVAHMINNYIAGPNFSALLNMIVRERHGLVYQIDSSYNAYSDTGTFSIYFASDKPDLDKAVDLINRELKKKLESGVSEIKFQKLKRQYLGQLKLAQENKESQLFGAVKAIMFLNRVDTYDIFYEKIAHATCEDFNAISREMLNPDNFSRLVYI